MLSPTIKGTGRKPLSEIDILFVFHRKRGWPTVLSEGNTLFRPR